MPPPKKGDPAGDRIEALYRAPLSGFVKVRDALARELKSEGHAESADRVKTLSKPAPGAWALNQVYWRDRAAFDRMIRAGDELRGLQQQMLAGRAASAREAMAERQAAVHEVVERAAAFLREDGNAMTAATRQRLATSADAMASYGSADAGYVPGRLTDDLEAPGFAALATLGAPALRLVHGAQPARSSKPAPPPGRPRARTDPKAERQEEREREAVARREAADRAKALRSAEQSLRDATRELDSVRQRAARARAAAEAVAQEQQTLEEQLARVTTRRRSADAASAAAADAVSGAERVRRDAEAALAAIRNRGPRG